jgi:putative endonuclease
VSKKSLYLGKAGEEAAVDLLRENGYKILVRNYKTGLGEIDIIADDQDTICFVEVKTRQSDKFGLPNESVLPSKQRQISKVAISYLKENNLLKKKARFDVVSIIYAEDRPCLELIKDAFELSGGFTY